MLMFMLARSRPVPWRSAQPAAHLFRGISADTSAKATDSVTYWRTLLGAAPEEPTPAPNSRDTAATAAPPNPAHWRRLLREALHVHRDRVPGVLPDQVSTVLLDTYSKLGDSQQRLAFFNVLAREFGVHSEQQQQRRQQDGMRRGLQGAADEWPGTHQGTCRHPCSLPPHPGGRGVAPVLQGRSCRARLRPGSAWHQPMRRPPTPTPLPGQRSR
jgi:hypothetical protein